MRADSWNFKSDRKQKHARSRKHVRVRVGLVGEVSDLPAKLYIHTKKKNKLVPIVINSLN